MRLFTGFFYRLGVSIKGFGERAGHKRRFYAGAVIRLGCAIRDMARERIRI
ncbi:MAG: hypothetical protein LBU85_08995 [Treponema sp.]|jgi:hypothetical protein|nr:hypothetical protein [Treponema sp.]